MRWSACRVLIVRRATMKRGRSRGNPREDPRRGSVHRHQTISDAFEIFGDDVFFDRCVNLGRGGSGGKPAFRTAQGRIELAFRANGSCVEL